MTHIDEPGTTSRDLRTLGRTHPAETNIPHQAREAGIQAFGTRCLTIGIIAIAAAFIGAFTCALITRNDQHPVAALYTQLGLIAAISGGTILIAVGSAERVQRFQRAMTREALALADNNEQRLHRIENAIDRVAEHLPDAKIRENWLGYTRAVRQEATATGTDGAAQAATARHLGLVPHSQPERRD